MKEFPVQDFILHIFDQEVFIETYPMVLLEDINNFCEKFPKQIDDLES